VWARAEERERRLRTDLLSALSPSLLSLPSSSPQDRPAATINSAAFHATEDLLYTAGDDDNVTIYDVAVRRRIEGGNGGEGALSHPSP
jgi:WD40 repeat protein